MRANGGTRKPSAHTLKAYRQDFDAIATLIAGGEDLTGMALGAIMIETMRTGFALYAETHEAARMDCASDSHRRVEPSISVNRNVTTPEGAAARSADTPAESHNGQLPPRTSANPARSTHRWSRPAENSNKASRLSPLSSIAR